MSGPSAPLARVRVVSTGWYAPPEVEDAEALAAKLGVDPAWIRAHVGVSSRRISREPVEVLAAHAVRQAIGDGPPPDTLLFASATPRQLIPDTAVFVAAELGWSGLAAWSVHASCLSFLAALTQAAGLISLGISRRVVIVSAERATLGRDLTDPESAALLGDGAAAVVLEATPTGESSSLDAFRFVTLPASAGLAEVRGYGDRAPDNAPADRLFRMQGMAIYRVVRRHLPELVQATLADAGLTLDDVARVIPHQASGRALDLMIPAVGVHHAKVVRVHDAFGNCVAASLPMALAMAHETGELRRGDRALLIGTGAGVSLAAAVLTW